MFIQWVGTYNLYPLEKLNEFGLPVDFQLCRISIQTGIVSVLPGPEIRREDFANSIFLPTIAYLCKKNNIRSLDFLLKEGYIVIFPK